MWMVSRVLNPTTAEVLGAPIFVAWFKRVTGVEEARNAAARVQGRDCTVISEVHMESALVIPPKFAEAVVPAEYM